MESRDCNSILKQIREEYIKLLAENLVGIYVHGSIAFDCFNWDKSDIDYLIVVNNPLTLAEKKAIMDVTVVINQIAPAKGIEMSVVLKKHCQNFIHPTPFELHFSNMHLAWYQKAPMDYCEGMNGTDADLAAHFTVIRHKGIVLCGDEIGGVFSSVDKEYYVDSIMSDIKDSKNEILINPVYIILNLCRVLAYVKEGLILSKREGGVWGMDRLSTQYHPLIRSALECYASDKDIMIDEAVASRFCNDMMQQIF